MVRVSKTRRTGRRTLNMLAVAALAGLSMTGLPQAQAQEGCAFNWGVKQSYRAYIKGKVAKGNWNDTTGIGFTGSETGADGAFVFTPGKATINGDTSATIPLQGTLNFKGHFHGGTPLLDMTISDIKLQVDGSNAQIIADYHSYESDMNLQNPQRTGEIRGDDVAIATISLSSPANTGSGSVNMAGSTTLTAEGSKLFLAYDAGVAMDPTSGSVKLDGSCAGGSGGGTGNLGKITGDFSGANKEVMGIVSETNDTMNGMTTLMGNAQQFQKQLQSFTGTNESGTGTSGGGSGTGTSGGTGTSTSGTAGNSTTAGSTPGAGTGTATTAGGGAGGGTGAAAGGGAEQAGGNGICTAEAARGVTNAQAAWGIKQSFQSYITGSIAKGKWTLNGVGHSGGQFQFTGNSGAVDPAAQSGTVGFSGGIHFSGHNGELDLHINNLEIEFNGNSGSLIAQVRSSDTSGNKTDFGRVALGNLQFSALNVNESSASGAATVSLTDAGSKAFAEFYEPGTQLDPITFEAGLGGAANCSESQASGAGGSGANNAAALKAAGGANSGDGTTTGYENGADKFKVKSAAADNSNSKLTPEMYLLVALAAFVVAGGSMGRLITNNPA